MVYAATGAGVEAEEMNWRRGLIWVWITATFFWGLTTLTWGLVLYLNNPSLFHINDMLVTLLLPIAISWAGLYAGFWIASGFRR